MPTYTVQQQVGLTTPYGPAEGHPMREDLVGEVMVLERGTRPQVHILDVYDTKDGLRCFGRLITGVAMGSTGFFPFDELESPNARGMD